MKTVMVVDDDHGVLRLLRVILRVSGFQVETFDDAENALSWLEAHAAPAAVVLDLKMPKMDGRRFFRELRGLGIQSPVVVASAYGAQAAYAELGAEAYMSKPFDPDRLAALLQTLTDTDSSV